jgi:hypothetical protein
MGAVMDTYTYLSIQARIEHYETIARNMPPRKNTLTIAEKIRKLIGPAKKDRSMILVPVEKNG